MAAGPQATSWSSRIVGHGEEPPDQLLANPNNWRIHPKHQQDALIQVLDTVGWVQEVIVNRTTGHVVDGHLRVAVSISRGEETVPVNYVELTEDEEAMVLATLDPLAGMAVADEDQLRSLVDGLDLGDGDLADMMDKLLPAPPPAESNWTPGDPVIHYDIIFDNEEQQQAWQGFIRSLVDTEPGETIGERLQSYIERQ